MVIIKQDSFWICPTHICPTRIFEQFRSIQIIKQWLRYIFQKISCMYILYFSASLSYFLLFSPILPWSYDLTFLSLFFLFFFIFSNFYFSLYLFFFLLLFVHLFLFILYGKINDPRIKSQILLCIVEIKLINFIIHKLNEFEQLIIIFKYIKYLINFINLDLMWIFNMF